MSQLGRVEFEACLGRLDAGAGDGLVRCALLVAREENPQLDMERCLRDIEAIAQSVAAQLSGEATVQERLQALNRVLFETMAFHGPPEEDYYNARNNFLDYVLECRTGIPISLCMLYMEVSRRVGLPLLGIGLPGHVVLLVAGAEEALFVDVFNGGALLDRAGLERVTQLFLSDDQPFLPDWLEPLQPRFVLARMLRNLKAIYAGASDMERLSWVCDWLVLTLPDDLVERRDRGLVWFSLKRYGLAAADLEYYLQRLVHEEERPPLEELYRKARQLQAWMN